MTSAQANLKAMVALFIYTGDAPTGDEIREMIGHKHATGPNVLDDLIEKGFAKRVQGYHYRPTPLGIMRVLT